MKYWLTILMTLCLLLTGCQEQPGETTLPATNPPVETTLPPQTTLPPSESTEPVTQSPETTLPPETTTPPTDPSYNIQVTDPEKLIYDGPGFRFPCNAMFGEAGTYTIVEEAVDFDGNLWGMLKSGIGWVCLTEPAVVPVVADYAPEHFDADHCWHCGETEYVTDIGVIPMEPITNVRFTLLDVIENYEISEVLFTVDALEAEETVLLSVVYWGDMTTYGLSFMDTKGNERFYALSVSGKDGSLICSEYVP